MSSVQPTEAAPAALAVTKPFQLVDDFWKDRLKFNGRTPRNLQELLVARADYEHRRRLAEIKAMAHKLALLDEFLPALAAKGVQIAHRDITTWDGGKTLRIHAGWSLTSDKLYAALVELGFKEIEREDLGSDQLVTMKHGRALLVRIDVSRGNQ
jgi:hypothetical protein